MNHIINSREESLEKNPWKWCWEWMSGKSLFCFPLIQWNLPNTTNHQSSFQIVLSGFLFLVQKKVGNYHMQKYESFTRKSKCYGPKIRFLILQSQITPSLVKDASVKRNSNR